MMMMMMMTMIAVLIVLIQFIFRQGLLLVAKNAKQRIVLICVTTLARQVACAASPIPNSRTTVLVRSYMVEVYHSILLNNATLTLCDVERGRSTGAVLFPKVH